MNKFVAKYGRILVPLITPYGENEEVDYGKLLQLTNIKEENIKTTISFDFMITLTTNRKYQTNIQIDIPAKEVIEKGVAGIELTEFNNLIFKRIEN